jgi:hypothetical protein
MVEGGMLLHERFDGGAVLDAECRIGHFDTRFGLERLCRRGQRHGIACGNGNLPAGLQHRFGGRKPHAVRSADNQDFFVF